MVPSLGRGFTDDGEAGEAGEFDLATLKTSKRIKTAVDADGIVFDPVSGHVFVVNGDSGSVSVIDPKLEQAVATVQAGEKLETPVAGQDGKVYVNGAGNREILRIDTRSNRIDARSPSRTARARTALPSTLRRGGCSRAASTRYSWP